MGVPKFFKWISERYPCISQVVNDDQIPSFDNFYLDMNGIIHNCSHDDSFFTSCKINEKEIFENVFSYVDFLFQIIKPKKLFFLAVDGVAPRAKMNQQRSRRFRSVQEKELAREKILKKNNLANFEDAFDSNCITPGTVFMKNLSEHLKYYISHRISTNGRWQSIKVVYSGPEVPGEGEHKIMSYIREFQSSPDWCPKTTHCLYGLDADLIFLGLVSHIPCFALLREEIKFSKAKKSLKTKKVGKDNFILLHLSLLREYCVAEFSNNDFERILDDWILLCFLVGNDFLPHLPHLHIAANGIEFLMDCYSKLLLVCEGQYLNEHGVLNIPLFLKFMCFVADFDRETYEKQNIALDFFCEETAWESEPSDNLKKPENECLLTIFKVANSFKEANDKQDDDFSLWRMQYYNEKLGQSPRENYKRVENMVHEYLRGIQWVLHYYYAGVISWNWFYPEHYAPFATEIAAYKKQVDFNFITGSPFTPLEQLMAVLPPQSKSLVPSCFHVLMESHPETSYFYPKDFKIDLNGKINDWEALVLLPFINEKVLLDAMRPLYKFLSPEENGRNIAGNELVYEYSEKTRVVKSPENSSFSDLLYCQVHITEKEKPTFPVQPFSVTCAASMPIEDKPFAKWMIFIGFPTLYTLPISFKLSAPYKVNVFGQSSRKSSFIITLPLEHVEKFTVARRMATAYLGKLCYTQWPHLKECLVVAIADKNETVHLDSRCLYEEVVTPEDVKNSAIYVYKYYYEEEKLRWEKDAKLLTLEYSLRKGVDIGHTKVIIKARKVSGVSTRVQLSDNRSSKTFVSVKSFSNITSAPAQTTILSDEPYQCTTTCFSDHFHVGTVCFYIGKKLDYYGAMCLIEAVHEDFTLSLFSTRYNHVRYFDIESIIAADLSEDFYWPIEAVEQKSGLPIRCIKTICSSCLVSVPSAAHAGGRTMVDIGLCVKFERKKQQRTFFAKYHQHKNRFEYSSACVELLKSYYQKFPKFLEAVCSKEPDIKLKIEDVYENIEEGMKVLEVLKEWLNQSKISSYPLVPRGSEVLPGHTLFKIERLLDDYFAKENSDKLQQEIVKFRRITSERILIPRENSIFEPKGTHYILGDRVVCISESAIVPCGFQGTVVAIYANTHRGEPCEVDVLFDRSFLGGSDLGGRCSASRGITLKLEMLLNCSFVRRVASKYYNSAAAVHEKYKAPPHTKTINPKLTNPSPLKQLPGQYVVTSWQQGESSPSSVFLNNFASKDSNSPVNRHHAPSHLPPRVRPVRRFQQCETRWPAWSPPRHVDDRRGDQQRPLQKASHLWAQIEQINLQ